MTGNGETPDPTIRLAREEAAQEEGYRPWGMARDGEKPAFVDLRRKDGSGELVAYPYLMRVAYSGDSLISLLCAGGQAVTIEGRGLGELVRRLQAQEVAFVQEFDTEKWGCSTEGTARIERIDGWASG